jgi:hypothetical protein
MNYTETYNKVYSALSESNLPHEKLHTSALRITDALNNIYCYTNKQFPDMMEEIMNVVNDFSSSIKFGGHDIDDK